MCRLSDCSAAGRGLWGKLGEGCGCTAGVGLWVQLGEGLWPGLSTTHTYTHARTRTHTHTHTHTRTHTHTCTRTHVETPPILFRSKSPSQVFLIVLQWLLALYKSCSAPPVVTLAYDNMCNLARLQAAQKPLPLPPLMDKAWLKVEKIIDVFHFGNHISEDCRKRFCPNKVKEDHPSFNTQAGVQTFVWVSRFRHILCSMNKTHHSFLFT